tara:strand:+ start:411 stop:1343 length:933 start_codon:yes stop_codon:yes gene_type:complete
MTAYYNEIDPYAAGWLRNLIAAGRIAAGDVDERSIREVKPDDIKAYTQCHFFAGIGVWSAALRLAGWADDRPVWTGSCPCQPFSAAGKGGGFNDERHLWPDLFRLIAECKPGVVFGEQVASKDGLAWLDLVQADLEGADYASAAVDLCAAGVGAPHIRQRLYWVADAHHAERGPDATRGDERHGSDTGRPQGSGDPEGCVGPSRLADADDTRLEGRCLDAFERADQCALGSDGVAGGESAARPTNGQWRDADWIFCRDGKWRPVEPGTFPLVDGATSRVGRLRAYGNAIVAPLAAEVIGAWMEVSLEGKD